MVRIQLDTGYLDVKEGTAVPLTFQVGDIRDISKRQGNFSKTITLIGSKNNNNLLNHYYDVNIIEGTFDINALTLCSVIQDGIPIMENASMQLTAIKKIQGTDGYEEQVDYEVLVKDSRADFFTAIANKELTDIDFSDFDHPFDSNNVRNRFTNTVVNGFKYFLPGSGDNTYALNEFKLAIFAKVYFDRIFNKAGFTYDWPTLSTYDRFDKLIIPYNGEIDNFDYQDYVVKANRGAVVYSGVNIGTGKTRVNAQAVTTWTETQDDQNIFNPLTGVYSVPFPIASINAQYYEYTITIQYSITITNGHATTCFSAAQNLGGGQSANASVYRPRLTLAGNNATVNLLQNVATNGLTTLAGGFNSPLSVPVGTTTIQASSTIVATMQLSANSISAGFPGVLMIRIDNLENNISTITANTTAWRQTTLSGAFANLLTINANITTISVQIMPSATIVPVGGTLQVNDYIPKKIKQSDFVKAVFNMYNLYAEVDNTQPNKLNLLTRDDFYDAGNEVDWTYKLAKDREQDLSFLPEITSKKVILTYASDKDSANAVYTSATNQIYGQAEVVFDNEYVKDITTQALLFGPTPIMRTVFNAFVPMIAGGAPQTNLRILYDGGSATCGPFNMIDYVIAGATPPFAGVSGQTTYPMVGHFDNALNPTFDINYATCAYYYYQPNSLTDNNLYNRYWRRTMGQINNGKMLTAYFDLKESDILSMKLNDKIRIDNSWWNINKILDYDANSRKLTKVELISIDTEVTFKPFISSIGIGIPSLSPLIQEAFSSIATKRSTYANVATNGTRSIITGTGNTVGDGLRVVVATDNADVTSNGIWVDDLHILGSINDRPIQVEPYVYIANLSQSGVADPTADVLLNTFGSITWVRLVAGGYEGQINDYVLGTILATEISVNLNNVIFDGIVSATYVASNNVISINTSQVGVGLSDNYLGFSTVEIKYYI